MHGFRDGVEFLKGHGTQNDFVLLPDPDGALELTPQRVRALCDRRSGLGADGVLRVLRARHLPDAGVDGDLWFMDYRNADGSIAEMCGNGVRVFARYLVDAGLIGRGGFAVGTRAGVRAVTVHPDGAVTVQMGPARVLGPAAATVAGIRYAGVAVNIGNPHLACLLNSDVDELDLTAVPGYDAAMFPDGVNVEFVNVLSAARIRARIHERGVGETRACGTGTVAAVAAMLHAAGRDTGECVVTIPGGEVTVTVRGTSSPGESTSGESTLTGPAELLARGTLSAEWWSAAGRETSTDVPRTAVPASPEPPGKTARLRTAALRSASDVHLS